MKTKIISQEKNPLLQREEFIMEIESNSIPSKEQIITDLGKKKELTIVNKVITYFGRKSFIADIVVYDNEKAKKDNHVIPKKIKKKMKEEEKAKADAEKKKKAQEAKKAQEETKKTE
jgi:ribosomal protein S24E